MSDHQITMGVRDKIPVLVGERYIVCHNEDYELILDLDEEWNAYDTVTVLFHMPRGGGTVTVLSDGGKCAVPACTEQGIMRVGITAGNVLRTSTPAEITVLRSARNDADEEAVTMPPDITQQIIARQDELEEKLEQGGGGVDLSEVNRELNRLETDKADRRDIPNVFPWAVASLPFTEAEISGTAAGAGFVKNPTNFADGKTYFRYHAGPNNFVWTTPNPQTGAVTITARGFAQYGENGTTRLLTYYDDGTAGPILWVVQNGEPQTVTVTTDPMKTLERITGNYDLENWILLDMSVMSIVADYPAPGGSAEVTAEAIESALGYTPADEDEVTELSKAIADKLDADKLPEAINTALEQAKESGEFDGEPGDDYVLTEADKTEIAEEAAKLVEVPESSGGVSLGMTGAAVGQIAKITEVNESGVPTGWEPVDLPGTWELVSEGETLASDNVLELSTGDIECRKLLFVVSTNYGENVTATVKVNGSTFHTGWYQFQHVTASQTNTVIVEKISNEFIGYKMRGMTLRNGEVFKLDGWTYITADKLNITFILNEALSRDSSYKIYRQV